MGFGRVGCKDRRAGDTGGIAKRLDTAAGRPNPTCGARNLSIRCVPAFADTLVSAARGALRAEQIARVVAVSGFVRHSKILLGLDGITEAVCFVQAVLWTPVTSTGVTVEF